MLSGFLLWKGIFMCHKLLVFLLRWGEHGTVLPAETLHLLCMSFVYRGGRGQQSREGGRAEEDESGQRPPHHRWPVVPPPREAYFGFVRSPFSQFLTALKTFTELPEVGSLGLDLLWLISCLVPFRMHENHLRRIYKVSQFIQGIPSWITL